MLKRLSLIYLLISYAIGPAHATFYTDPVELRKANYDFVIVGGGTAGNVIANRLTESGEFSVLVIEAGITNQGALPSIVPFLAPSIQPASPLTWNYTTIPQAGLDNRVLNYPRGKILGGSSSINFLTYNRGSDDEYDRWANLTGDHSWSWEKIAPYYFKSERLVPSTDGHDTSGQANASVHGNGPVQISLPNFPTETDSRVINASRELGGEFIFNLDMQSGNSIGITLRLLPGVAQSAIGNGERSSSATAHLDPALARPNLDVLVQTQVTRLIRSGTTRRGPLFTRVEFSQRKKFYVTAKNEVILSAGTVNTPQLLLLSGIGNKTTLGRIGVKTIVNLPDVGQHMQDHPVISNYFTVNSTNTFDTVLRDPNAQEQDLQEWNSTRMGLFADAPATTIGFGRINSSILQGLTDPSAGLKSGHYEMLFVNGFGATLTPAPATGNFLTVNTVVVSPVSLGSVTLASSDPFSFPQINPAFLTSPLDSTIMVESIKAVRRFLKARAWQGYLLQPFGTLGAANTDDEIKSAVREGVVTIWHPTSTARMSPENAAWGVVDPNLLVKGVSGLRIVDASVMPVIPAAHTTGPVYIVAERAADLIKEAWCLRA
ncbi:aryl-alcohol-oxidase from pleurotus Eryingii [Infundibulicybe gibba]|nr:aryl-alcohol-oxidase from pleurotus Eryingii [Infundibulicybe gibba]